MAPVLKVAVIGAGVSGLATARALKTEGHQVVVYEKSDQLGGTWVYNPQVESDPLGLDPDREICYGYVWVNRDEDGSELVVVCNGHYTQPSLADFPGIEKWPGKQMHSHNYRVPEPFQDQIVVVIGDGPSAIDISLEISKVAKEVHLSSKSPDVKIRKLDCVDSMWQHSKIDHVDGNGEVIFQECASVHADIILHCTGYQYYFPFLKTEEIVAVDDSRVGPLYKHIFSPQLAPNLSFVGLPYNSTPVFLTIDLQAKWIARVLSDHKTLLPSEEEMLANVQQHYRYMDDKGIPKHYTHNLGHEFVYSDWLASQLGLAGADEQTRSVLKRYSKFVVEKGLGRCREWRLDSVLQEHEP